LNQAEAACSAADSAARSAADSAAYFAAYFAADSAALSAALSGISLDRTVSILQYSAVSLIKKVCLLKEEDIEAGWV
jgi:hypothetical protein